MWILIYNFNYAILEPVNPSHYLGSVCVFPLPWLQSQTILAEIKNICIFIEKTEDRVLISPLEEEGKM